MAPPREAPSTTRSATYEFRAKNKRIAAWGLEAQRQRIVAYCTMKGLNLAEVFEDPGVSAGKPLARRPAGSRLLAAARKGRAVVVVAKLDRLFRSVADAANVIDDFDKKGIQLVAISEALDMTSPYGRAMAEMASVFAELERAMIRERTRSAMSVKRSRGERISGHAPFGWDFGTDGHLVINVREQQVIGLMQRRRRMGCPTGVSQYAWMTRAFSRSGAGAGSTPRSRASWRGMRPSLFWCAAGGHKAAESAGADPQPARPP
jgi:DNA invertase Pin-like site-specific DNA recombinase